MPDQPTGTRLDNGFKRGEEVEIIVDGQPVKAFRGETIAAALLAAGRLTSRTIDDQPMGVYCNIGLCHSCLMTVNGVRGVRICKTPVSDGCRVESQHFEKGEQ